MHKLLSQWTYSLVVRGVTIPPECVVDGVVSHYYTTAEELAVSCSSFNKKVNMVWVKKKARWVGSRWLGPISLTDEVKELPKMGDILMGEITTVAGSQKEFGRQKFVAERQCYKWWLCNAAPIYYLATIVLKGTSETEKGLRTVLQLPGGYDDLWVLARIVLFNNIQCVVDLADPNKRNLENIKLQQMPVKFVHQLSMALQDLSLLTEFQKLVPAQVIQEMPTIDRTLEAPGFVGRKRRVSVVSSTTSVVSNTTSVVSSTTSVASTRVSTSAVQEEYNPERPSYFDFSHRRPAGDVPEAGKQPQSPTYDLYTPSPNTPTYDLHTPPSYVPVSPSYDPVSPPCYAPSSPHSSSYPPLCYLK